jgi:hypothetical protein
MKPPQLLTSNVTSTEAIAADRFGSSNLVRSPRYLGEIIVWIDQPFRTKFVGLVIFQSFLSRYIKACSTMMFIMCLSRSNE